MEEKVLKTELAKYAGLDWDKLVKELADKT